MKKESPARRAEKAGIDADMCCHTFRATGLTNFLANGGTLENAQAMADHASPRTTQLHDRTGDEITLDESSGSRFDRRRMDCPFLTAGRATLYPWPALPPIAPNIGFPFNDRSKK